MWLASGKISTSRRLIHIVKIGFSFCAVIVRAQSVKVMLAEEMEEHEIAAAKKRMEAQDRQEREQVLRKPQHKDDTGRRDGQKRGKGDDPKLPPIEDVAI